MLNVPLIIPEVLLLANVFMEKGLPIIKDEVFLAAQKNAGEIEFQAVLAAHTKNSVDSQKTVSINNSVQAIPTTPTNVSEYLLKEINNFRVSEGLTASQMNNIVCDFAKTRAAEISTKFNHEGFDRRLNSNTLPYPSFSKVTENLAMNSSYKDVVTSWLNSPGHKKNILSDTPFVCVEKYGSYYVYEGWKP